MHRNAKFVITIGLLSGLCLLHPGSLHADTIYTYTGGVNGSFQVTVTLDTTLSGAALHSLAPGTDITADLGPSFAFNYGSYLNTDLGGFPAADFSVTTPVDVKIGTDALGNITSWNITEGFFVSFPAFPGENPNDFYDTYTLSTTNSGDRLTLVTANDAGFDPGSTSAGAGTWSPTFEGPATPTVPEPSSLILCGLGAAGVLGAARRRRKT